MTIQWLALILSLIVLVLVLELVRREKLTFKYAFAWLFLSMLGVICSVFRELLFSMASLCGFELASNFIFFAILCAFVFLSLLMTVFLCQQNKRNDKMAQAIGLLEQELRELKGRTDGR
ncbi:MAG: DUF2304 domain-containing protein [Candidatus Omnitrophota bacterium]